MKLFNLFSGNTQKSKEKSAAEIEQENRDEAEVQEVYRQAKKEQRMKNAKQRAIQDADKIANQKPFYQKVMSTVTAIGKDVMESASNIHPNNDALFTFDNESERQKKRRKKKRN